jgi:hypothetical protein
LRNGLWEEEDSHTSSAGNQLQQHRHEFLSASPASAAAVQLVGGLLLFSPTTSLSPLCRPVCLLLL